MSNSRQYPAQLQEVGERGYSRWKWRVLIGAMFCYLFFYTGRQTFGFAIPGIEEEFGVSKATLGGVSAAMLWCYAAGQAVNGNLADKFGGRKLMTLGAILSTVLNWATSFAVGVKSLGLAWGLNGYVQAMGWPSGGRVVSNWWGARERGRAFGFYTLAAGMASVLAFVSSTVIVEILDLDWRWIFRLPVLLMLVGGIAFYLIARENPREARINPPASYTEDPDTGKIATAETKNERSLDRYKAVLRNPKIIITGLAIGFQNSARYGLLIWVPVYFLGTDWEDSGAQSGVNPIWISVALPVGMAVGALVNGQLSDRVFGSRRDRPIMLFMGLGALCAMTMYLAPLGTVAGILVLFLTGFFVYGPQSSFWALCPDLAGKRMAGTATGVVNFFAYLFAGVSEPVIGAVMDHTGNTGLVFPIVAGACVGSALMASLIRR